MNKTAKFFLSIGARGETRAVAATQLPSLKAEDKHAVTDVVYLGIRKTKMLDRWLDKIVALSGSNAVLLFTVIALLAWALLGIKFADRTGWQVGISDAQAIINMVFDSFLVRQQLNAYDETLVILCQLQSRAESHRRMLRVLGPRQRGPLVASQRISVQDLPTQGGVFARFCVSASGFMGHLGTVTAYWVCIGIWLGFGHHCGWSSTWFFYINSATSALMVLLLAFLANNRERHEKHLQDCVSLIYSADATLERMLRDATGDKVENQTFIIPAPEVGKIQRVINFYADLVGTLLGIVLLALVLVVWVVLGPVMSFNDNWWLLIGTYAGLIGMNDGFVLRNLCNVCNIREEEQHDQRILDDQDFLAIVGLTESDENDKPKLGLNSRLSIIMGDVCSHELTVVAGVVVIAGLIATATAMDWSELGQIICNVPPSIVESFFTLILITGHNLGDQKRYASLRKIHQHRLQLINYLEGM
ncbi:Low affinity iron permease [Aureobasidium sp. EXF-3400]|nr:Low affinity iron permease [Aureobasidium sp. EXF-12344]KAI4773532.1 Low affinity iron permease [Aureobasidium sp. EXF-3400]